MKKQGGHLNKAINLYGRELVGKHFKLKETTDDQVSKTGFLLEHTDGSSYQCKIFTKIHDEREGMKVTGRDRDDVLRFEAIQRETKKPVMLLFVDAACGVCYGDLLDNLSKEREFCGTKFPIAASTHAGVIAYWSVDLMPTLFALTQDEKNHLAGLISDNRTNKNQGKLF